MLRRYQLRDHPFMGSYQACRIWNHLFSILLFLPHHRHVLIRFQPLFLKL